MAGGRPPKYKDEYPKQAEVMCKLGAVNADLADAFEVSERTIERWSVEHEEFCRALRVGKEEPDQKVVRALYHRAIGYSHPDVDIRVLNGEIVKTPITKHYPPDTKAALAWVFNRMHDEWHPHPDGSQSQDKEPVVIQIVNPNAESDS